MGRLDLARHGVLEKRDHGDRPELGDGACRKGNGFVYTAMAEKEDVLLNSREVALLLDLSPDTVNEFARRNILPAFKKGRQWRFRKRDITSFKRQLRGLHAA